VHQSARAEAVVEGDQSGLEVVEEGEGRPSGLEEGAVEVEPWVL
jgi:hypothetical protein